MHDPASSPRTPAAGHASYVFLLGEAGEVHPLPHALYVALARGEGQSAQFAHRSFRLADWYVRLKQGRPERVVNEWYGRVRFDAAGRFLTAPQGGPAPADPSLLPTADERARMRELIFGRGED